VDGSFRDHGDGGAGMAGYRYRAEVFWRNHRCLTALPAGLTPTSLWIANIQANRPYVGHGKIRPLTFFLILLYWKWGSEERVASREKKFRCSFGTVLVQFLVTPINPYLTTFKTSFTDFTFRTSFTIGLWQLDTVQVEEPKDQCEAIDRWYRSQHRYPASRPWVNDVVNIFWVNDVLNVVT